MSLQNSCCLQIVIRLGAAAAAGMMPTSASWMGRSEFANSFSLGAHCQEFHPGRGYKQQILGPTNPLHHRPYQPANFYKCFLRIYRAWFELKSLFCQLLPPCALRKELLSERTRSSSLLILYHASSPYMRKARRGLSEYKISVDSVSHSQHPQTIKTILPLLRTNSSMQCTYLCLCLGPQCSGGERELKIAKPQGESFPPNKGCNGSCPLE